MHKITALDFCTREEQIVLVAIAALAKSLPNPSAHYIQAFGEITSRYFSGSGGRRGVHNPSPGSLAQTHSIRASKRG